MRSRTGGGLIAFLAVLVVGLVVAVGLAARALFDVVPLWVFIAVGVVELGAAGSAVLDWRDAKLEIGTKRRALLVGHVTLVRRLARRARWHASTLRLLVPSRAQQQSAAPAARAEPLDQSIDDRAAS